jgi:hypothetical protein
MMAEITLNETELAIEEAKKPDKDKASIETPAEPRERKRVKRTPVQSARRINFKRLIAQRFAGNLTRMAKALDRTDTYVWQLVHDYRSISENTARHIETQLKLSPGALDAAHKPFERTTKLTAQFGNGTTKDYVMVPRVQWNELKLRIVGRYLKDYERITGRELELRPCPVACSMSTTYAILTSTEMEPRILYGANVFSDPENRKLVHDKLYVVWPPRANPAYDEAVPRVAHERTRGEWAFKSLLGDSEEWLLNADKIELFGRVIHIGYDV